MIRRHRQGWRVLVVLSRVAVAGVLTLSGPPGSMRPAAVFAQTGTTPSQHPPPPPRAPARPLPADADSPTANPGRSADPPARNTDASQPTPAVHVTAKFDSPPQIVLPVPPSLEELTARRNSLNRFLHRDRRHDVLLSRGDRALAGGEVDVALSHFQALVEATHDAFYWPDETFNPRGAQSSAHGRLQSLPLQLRETYQQRHGDEARALLIEALDSNDDLQLLEVLQRFRLTDAGREAMIRELVLAYDCGHLTRATELARRLAGDPYHWQQLSPRLQLFVSRLDAGAGCGSCADRTDSTTNVCSISPPALRPLWTCSLGDGLASLTTGDDAESPAGIDRFVEEAICRWLIEHDDRRLPVTTANQATVVDDLLLIRDLLGVRALDLQTGRPVWHYRCAGSLAAAAEKCLQEESRGGGTPPLCFHTHFAGQGPTGRLTTDRRRVFLVDRLDASGRSKAPGSDEVSPHADNRLVALSLDSPEPGADGSNIPVPKTAWVRGSGDTDTLAPLKGHFFLGPPLPVDGRLFVLTEHGRRLHCIALDAADGELLWQQPISVVEQPIDWDTVREQMACTPLYAGSVVVCPTEVGVVVGVDALTGALRWVYDHIDDDQRLAAGRWSSSTQRTYGGTEFPSRLLYEDGCVFHLPFRSRFVHCIDAATGSCVWTADRRGALALSAVTPDQVILIGEREVMSLDSADRSLRWKTTCPEPAGHGLIAGEHYLLPTGDGRCVSLSLSDGSLSGSRFGRLLHELSELSEPPTGNPPAEANEVQLAGYDVAEEPQPLRIGTACGNLLAAEDVVVVTTPTCVAVYPQARPLLETLSVDAGDGGLDPQQVLEAAMLHLLLGDQAAAGHQLRTLLKSPSPASIHRAATRLLREILFTELAATADPRPILDQLATMPGDDRDHLRLLVSRIDAELKLESPRRLLEAIDLFRAVNAPAHVNPDSEAEYFVEASSYVADQLAVARSRADENVRLALESYVSRASAEAATSGDIDDCEQLLLLFGAWPQVADLRNDVAEACREAGHLQRAELLLLESRSSANRGAAARARRLLTDLYASQSFHREAAENLIELATDFRDDPVGRGMSGGEFAEQFPRDHPAWRIVRRRRAASVPAYHVRITEHVCDEKCRDLEDCRAAAALAQHDRVRRKFLIGEDSTLTIIDRGIVPGDRNHSQLTLANRETGAVHAAFNLPAAYWQPSGGTDLSCGQLLPVCGRTAHGLSLLERRTLWSIDESNAAHTRDKVKLGPIGTGFCVLQTTRRLSVIHPATGEILWERGNLPPDVGLLTNESTGIIGDAETLTLFGADQRAYTVYRMRSGRKVRRGRLNVPVDEARRHRRAVGAKLVHVVTADAQQVLRVWDAATDRIVFEEPLLGQLFCPIGRGTQYALINPDGRLLVIDVATGRFDLDLPLPDGRLEDVTDLAVTSDRDHYFVNLVGCANDSSAETAAATDEVELPSLRVQGRLLAVSKTGRLLWQQAVPDSVLLTNSACSMPVSTLISRVRDAENRQTSRLRIDVLDTRSGETLARHDDLLRTRIVGSTYEPRPGRLSLIGLHSQIEIAFGPERQEFLIHAEVDAVDDSLVR